ncbi:hypothetical protein WOLCODRAFT_138452 [Wolfiporia cocos MD-104 SS10]|uniref:Uncharacterized protein n=1 Tax=Wolfiporia cocos (strain MD-104) TaxID=742152 RepID=A0A2H3JN35_WOLCO|nr:hypothetical protein WOLCODRAFT_138452 [Wolfiporia cocos MD-104 SS10]
MFSSSKPAKSRPLRAEAIQAKYNVSVDFPNLGLHSGAASGNVGLVKYALEHGQPINSVLDGVLPLHVACSGGNGLIVQLLIDMGADVNAPRLPRRYSSDKNRDSPIIVGASGSTPLHFACANGHTQVVQTLLLHGAHPDRADKHGMTPEMLARQKGFDTCADVLQQWSHNRDRDLREKDELNPPQHLEDAISSKEEQHTPCGSSDCRFCLGSKRLRVKKSIDNALNKLMPSLSQASLSTTSLSQSSSLFPPSSELTPPRLETIIASPIMASDTLDDSAPRASVDSDTVEGAPTRRPSLPSIFDAGLTVPITRKTHHSTSFHSYRPSSAGGDADRSSSTHRMKGKHSLRNIFSKKGIESPDPESSSTLFLSGSSSPVPRHQRAASSTPVSAHGTPSRHAKLSLDNMRAEVDSPGGRRGRSIPVPSALELHRAMSDDRLRAHARPSQEPTARSASSMAHRSPSTRPGILRPHNRSMSSEQSHTGSQRSGSVGPPSARALRFDASSTTDSTAVRQDASTSRSPPRGMRGTKSMNSIRDAGSLADVSPRMRVASDVDGSAQVPRYTDEPEDVRGGQFDDEEQYGEPVDEGAGISELKSRLDALSGALADDERTRRHSTVSTRTSSSPLPSPSAVIISNGFDGPFSINQPLPASEDTDSPMANSLGIHGVENRLRGDSMSSMSTTASGYLTTPGIAPSQLPSPHIASAISTPPEYPSVNHSGRKRIHRAHSGATTSEVDASVLPKLSRHALDIDISSISSHAQAEALVQRAQQSILDMQDIEVNHQREGDSTFAGRTPLSARLAAYGESLAIERKFKQEEQRRNSSSTARSAGHDIDGVPRYAESAISSSSSIRGLDRKYSLEERSYNNRTVRQSRSRRPHTSNGISSTDLFQTPPRDGSLPPQRRRSAASPQVGPDTNSSNVSGKGEMAVSLTPPRSSHLKVFSETFIDTRPKLRRSLTPDPESDVFLSSRVGDGAPLSRVSTAPAQDTPFLSPHRGPKNVQERHVASVNKLVKMGFSSTDYTMGNTRSVSGSRQRFAGIKGFVHSLTGK